MLASAPAPSPRAASPRLAQAETNAAPAEPAPQLRTAYSAPPAATSSILTGAQPVVPVGSFAQRWSGSN